MAIASPSSDLVARFVREVDALTPNVERLGIAVSGGPDSLALLLLAHAAFPGRVAAATVDHGLRAGSGKEVCFVADLCATLAVPHVTLTVEVDTRPASLQQSARHARYHALAGWMRQQGMTLIATAHHLDDQAETLLMRLLRGAGVAGLAGVRARAPLPAPGSDLQVVRPLLGWRKSELVALVASAGITPVDDASNRDPRFDRTLARARLAAEQWIDPIALARSAAAMADAEEALGWTAHGLYDQRVRAEGTCLLFDHTGLPREIKRRILLALLTALEPAAAPRGGELDRLLVRLERGGSSTLAGIKCSGGAEWRFERAPPRRSGT
jgi:tRNA(Ile)-lysidine synthase